MPADIFLPEEWKVLELNQLLDILAQQTADYTLKIREGFPASITVSLQMSIDALQQLIQEKQTNRLDAPQ